MPNAPFYDEGLHFGKIMRQTITKAKTGTVQLVLGVKVLGVPQDDGSYAPHRQQYERSIYMAITEKTAPFVAETLEYLDFSGKFSQLDASHPQHVSLVGREVDLWCKHEADQNGGYRERWQISRGGPALVSGATLSSRELRDLDSLFGKSLKAAKPEAMKPTTPAAEDATEITDDDIPF